jgi:hypothetical protein
VYGERFVRSIRTECLDQMIVVGRASLERVISEVAGHYHEERSHQGLGNEIPSGVTAQRADSVGVSGAAWIESSDTSGRCGARAQSMLAPEGILR